MTDTPTRRDFFISYNRNDEAWATWIAGTLEAAGYSVFVQAWDFRAGANFVLEMDTATVLANRTIAVLSPDFLASQFTPAEWAAAFALDPLGDKRLLVPVRVRPCTLIGLLAQIIYIDLVGKDAGAARELLLGGLSASGLPRRTPNFPGAAAIASGATFPGTDPESARSSPPASRQAERAATPPVGSRTAALREQIMRKLRTDSDLDAFCLDYFPAVKRNFTNGMDRTRKINLLLESVDADDITAALREFS